MIPGYTPAHSIRLYIQRQIEIIRQSDLFLADSNRKNVDDCLLIWQLLEMVVQQQGVSLTVIGIFIFHYLSYKYHRI